ncbi:DUF3102 domain-containing protein [Bradyrhizobium frederickii]|uniref:DUF3102 domain-containing protein n=1 Tax=Bradyrhizobium frederickii TaxID=2560054 RepID=A0A4Y9P1N4_9BRAD|nr:DUF3102 domain-containing protein [Bradyrhizobium frederickii]TFV74114.1 DUF3102 domain-containing protein [Bradyrhizobium frederickii]
MNETLKRFIGSAMPITTPDAPASKGELTLPSVTDLAATALRAHNAVEAAALNAVLKAMECGKALTIIKEQLPHGSFEDFVAAHFPFTIRTAQSYMRLAKQEPKLQELVEAKAKLGSHLSIKEALKYLNAVAAKKRR